MGREKPEALFFFLFAPLARVCYTEQKRDCAADAAGKIWEEKHHGSIQSLLYGFPLSGGHQPAGKAAPGVHCRRHQGYRHGRPVRGHQDALRRAGQSGLSAPQLRQGGGRPVQGAGRYALPDRLQHPVPGQPQECAGAPELRPAERLLAHDHRLSGTHRRWSARHG